MRAQEPGLYFSGFELHWRIPLSSSFRKPAVDGGLLSPKDQTLNIFGLADHTVSCKVAESQRDY